MFAGHNKYIYIIKYVCIHTRHRIAPDPIVYYTIIVMENKNKMKKNVGKIKKRRR